VIGLGGLSEKSVSGRKQGRGGKSGAPDVEQGRDRGWTSLQIREYWGTCRGGEVPRVEVKQTWRLGRRGRGEETGWTDLGFSLGWTKQPEITADSGSGAWGLEIRRWVQGSRTGGKPLVCMKGSLLLDLSFSQRDRLNPYGQGGKSRGGRS